MTKLEEPDFEELSLAGMDTPELLMEATVWILAAEGYKGLTLRKVAEKAEKNRGLVHYYFDSKADLLVSLIEHIRNGTSRLIGIDDRDPPLLQLTTALRFHAYGPGGIDDHGRHYYLAILQLQALAAHDPSIRDEMGEYYRFVITTVEKIIEDGIDRGHFRAVDPKNTAQFFLITIDGARSAAFSTNLPDPRDTAIAQLEEHISTHLLR